jgi:hypothetical protein
VRPLRLLRVLVNLDSTQRACEQYETESNERVQRVNRVGGQQEKNGDCFSIRTSQELPRHATEEDEPVVSFQQTEEWDQKNDPQKYNEERNKKKEKKIKKKYRIKNETQSLDTVIRWTFR